MDKEMNIGKSDILNHNSITIGSATKGAAIKMYYDLDQDLSVVQNRIDKFLKIAGYLEQKFGLKVR